MQKTPKVLRYCVGLSVGILIGVVSFSGAMAEDKNSVFSKSPEEFKRLRPPPVLAAPAPQKPLPVVQPVPVIDEIEGADYLTAQGPHGPRSVHVGEALDFGESLETGSEVSSKILFYEGSQVLMGKGTEIVIERPGSEFTESPTVPAIEVKKGETRILVEGEPQKKSVYRFLTRTKSAVLGVRGTDYIVSVSNDQATVHTVSGVVDVAADYSGLKSHKVTEIQSGHVVWAHAGRPFAAKPFETGTFLREFHLRHPHLEALWNRASLDSKNKKFKNLKFPTGVPFKSKIRALREARRAQVPKASVSDSKRTKGAKVIKKIKEKIRNRGRRK